MILRLMLMIAGGIALALAFIDPHRVSARVLRVSTGLELIMAAGAAALALGMRKGDMRPEDLAGLAVPLLVLVQWVTLWQRRWLLQRIIAVMCFVVFSGLIAMGFMAAAVTHTRGIAVSAGAASLLNAPVACGIAGGFLVAALLCGTCPGAPGEAPWPLLRRIVLMLLILLGMRLALSLGAGFAPWWRRAVEVLPNGTFVAGPSARHNVLPLVAGRYLAGILLPAASTLVALHWGRRGRFGLASVALVAAWAAVLVGEGMALALAAVTCRVF
jgi:hypothetical protein